VSGHSRGRFSAFAEECTDKTESYEDKSHWSAIRVAPVEDVIKPNLDGYLMIHYIVQYKGLLTTDYAVGEQLSFTVGKLESPADPR
jgi:hypothetical protein